jgi:hypothetical protein
MDKRSNIEAIKKAYFELRQTNLNQKTIFYALNLLARLIEKSPKYRDEYKYVMASAFISVHQPKYVNNTLNLESFCNNYGLAEDEINSAVQVFINELDLITFPSNNGEDFFVDKDGVLYSVLQSITKEMFNNAVLSKVVDNADFDLENLIEEVTSYFIDRIRIISYDFSKSSQSLVKTLLKQLM